MDEGQAATLLSILSNIASDLQSVRIELERFNENFRENSADSAAMVAGSLDDIRVLMAQSMDTHVKKTS